MPTLDPFGPVLKINECGICCKEVFKDEPLEERSGCLQDWSISSCNFGVERAKLFDQIIDALNEKWKQRHQPSWINDKMQIDWVRLTESGLLTEEQKTRLGPEATPDKQLLDTEGYFNLDGIHGACQKCSDAWVALHKKCHICNDTDVNAVASKYLNQRIEKGDLELSPPQGLRPEPPKVMTTEVGSFLGEVKGMFIGLGRSVIGGAGKTRGEHLQSAMHHLDHLASVVINGLVHSVLFHGAVKVALLAFQRLSFKGLDNWIRLADNALEWNLGWARHVLIWKAFISAFDYTFRGDCVNLTYTAISHHIARMELLAVLWLAFKVAFRADFGWSMS